MLIKSHSSSALIAEKAEMSSAKINSCLKNSDGLHHTVANTLSGFIDHPF